MRTSIIRSAVLLFIVLFCAACSFNRTSLHEELAEKSGLSGTFTVILYGAHYYNDIATVAFLVPDGAKYALEIYSPDYNYRTLRGLTAPEAIRAGEKFISWHPEYLRSQFSRVLDGSGKVVAYEIRPIYNQITFGVGDVMDIDYFLQGNNMVGVHVNLAEPARRIFMGDDQGKVH